MNISPMTRRITANGFCLQSRGAIKSLFGTVTGVLMVGGGSSGQAQLIGADWRGIGQNPLEPEQICIKRKPVNGNLWMEEVEWVSAWAEGFENVWTTWREWRLEGKFPINGNILHVSVLFFCICRESVTEESDPIGQYSCGPSWKGQTTGVFSCSDDNCASQSCVEREVGARFSV